MIVPSIVFVHWRYTMQSIKTFFAAIALSILTLVSTGCASTQPPKIVYKSETIYQEVPQQLIQPVAPTRPIPKEQYLGMAIYERESYMVDYSVQTLKSLHTCNAQLSSIAELSKRWKEKVNADQQKD